MDGVDPNLRTVDISAWMKWAGEALYPNIAAMGQRGVPGSKLDFVTGFGKTGLNLAIDISKAQNPIVSLLSGDGPLFSVRDEELAGAATFDVATVLGGVFIFGESAATRLLPRLEISASKYPELAENIFHAQRAGHSEILTRGPSSIRRPNHAASTKGVPEIPGTSKDEYPFAVSYEGGEGSWIGHVPPSQQQAQGVLITQFFNRYGVN